MKRKILFALGLLPIASAVVGSSARAVDNAHKVPQMEISKDRSINKTTARQSTDKRTATAACCDECCSECCYAGCCDPTNK